MTEKDELKIAKALNALHEGTMLVATAMTEIDDVFDHKCSDYIKLTLILNGIKTRELFVPIGAMRIQRLYDEAFMKVKTMVN